MLTKFFAALTGGICAAIIAAGLTHLSFMLQFRLLASRGLFGMFNFEGFFWLVVMIVFAVFGFVAGSVLGWFEYNLREQLLLSLLLAFVVGVPALIIFAPSKTPSADSREFQIAEWLIYSARGLVVFPIVVFLTAWLLKSLKQKFGL